MIAGGAFDPLTRGLGCIEGWFASLLGLEAQKAPGTLSTGVQDLDEALGQKGYRRGGVVEVRGPAGEGKTTFTLATLLAAQRQGEAGAVVDVDFALPRSRGSQLGLDPRRTVVVRPPSGEAAVEIALRLMRARAFSVVVVDSITALGPTPRAGLRTWPCMGAEHFSFLERARRAMARVAAETSTCLLLVEHGTPSEEGNGNSTPPGSYAEVAIEVACAGVLTRGAERVGTRTRLRVLRDRCGVPGRDVYAALLFDYGLSKHEWRPTPGKGAIR